MHDADTDQSWKTYDYSYYSGVETWQGNESSMPMMMCFHLSSLSHTLVHPLHDTEHDRLVSRWMYVSNEKRKLHCGVICKRDWQRGRISWRWTKVPKPDFPVWWHEMSALLSWEMPWKRSDIVFQGRWPCLSNKCACKTKRYDDMMSMACILAWFCVSMNHQCPCYCI